MEGKEWKIKEIGTQEDGNLAKAAEAALYEEGLRLRRVREGILRLPLDVTDNLALSTRTAAVRAGVLARPTFNHSTGIPLGS